MFAVHQCFFFCLWVIKCRRISWSSSLAMCNVQWLVITSSMLWLVGGELADAWGQLRSVYLDVMEESGHGWYHTAFPVFSFSPRLFYTSFLPCFVTVCDAFLHLLHLVPFCFPQATRGNGFCVASSAWRRSRSPGVWRQSSAGVPWLPWLNFDPRHSTSSKTKKKQPSDQSNTTTIPSGRWKLLFMLYIAVFTCEKMRWFVPSHTDCGHGCCLSQGRLAKTGGALHQRSSTHGWWDWSSGSEESWHVLTSLTCTACWFMLISFNWFIMISPPC